MKLKSYQIGFEVPFFEPTQEQLIELSSNLSDKYLDSFDVLVTELVPDIRLSNTNHLILYNLIVRVDENFINPETFDRDWDEMTEGIKESLLEFFKTVEYKLIEL